MNYGKYSRVLALLAIIPQARTKEVRYGKTVHLAHDWDGIMTGDQAVEAMDHLLEYMHANFQPPASERGSEQWEKDKAEILHILSKAGLNQEYLGYLETLPPYYSEIAFPVAVIRYLLRDLQMPINHRKSKHFSEFHNRYGDLILSA